MSTPAFDPQPCCDDAASAGCSAPVQFCQTSTSTGPVEYPGRIYDITLPINPGFTVDSIIMDAVTQNAGLTWSIFDPDGSQFATDLKSFIESRMSGTTVTVTNPNAGVQQVCGEAQPMQIHIECLRVDQDAPDLVELMFNAGVDLIQNPAYNETPPVDDETCSGFHLSRRTDNGGTLNCTSVANRGWETNDAGETFELWCANVRDGQNTTPTPRGTPVQEITSDGPPPGGRSTIWQTFNVPAAGTFSIRVVHGARDPGENHRITLSTGDTDDNQVGDVINDVTTPPSVTNSGGPNPWTTFSQNLPLNAGEYTLALSTNNPVLGARGGVFTDMRVFLDRPNTRATAVTDDDTCTVTATETTENVVCTFWQPTCSGGTISDWTNVETGQSLTNAEFWAQTPKPSCCGGGSGGAAPGASGVQSNLLISDLVCAQVNGNRQTVIREVLFDASGGELEVAFIAPNGARVVPVSWSPGECLTDVNDLILCDRQPDGSTVSFLRKYVQTWSEAAGAQILTIRDFTISAPPSTYTVTGEVVVCSGDTFTTTGLCLGDNTPIGIVNRRTSNGDVVQDGWINLLTGTFVPGVPPPGASACGSTVNVQTSDVLCDITTATGEINGLVLIQYNYNPDGSIGSTDILNATTGDPYVPTGSITVCPTDQGQPDRDMQLLCDVQANGAIVPIIRDYVRDVNGQVSTFSDYTVAGAPYNATGTVGGCIPRDVEAVVLCDSAAVPNRFLRTFTYTPTGTIVSFTDTTLAGAAFVPTGAVGVCPGSASADRDFAEEILCDANGTQFVRRFTFNSVTGAVISTANLTLTGAAFAPVGAVGLCTECCPNVIGEGCTNVGSGRYTAIRATNGTVSLIDSVSGVAVLSGNIIACPPQPVAPASVTLTAQGRLVGDADTPWNPSSDVIGRLTSVTLTVLSGTATVTDANGTVMAGLPTGYSATWEVEDQSFLAGPESIDAVGGQTAVVWTQTLN